MTVKIKTMKLCENSLLGLFFLFHVFVFAACSFSFLRGHLIFDFYTFVPWIIHGLIATTTGYFLKKGWQKAFAIPEKSFVLGLATVLVLFIISRVYLYQQSSVWLDEYTQWALSTQNVPVHILKASSTQQQPYLGYLLSHLIHEIFGNHFATLKMGTLIFSFLSITSFYAVAIRLTANVLVSTILSVAFLLFPEFILQSLEARNMTLMLFNEILLLLSVFLFFQRKNKRNAALVLMTGFSFAVSVGFQTIILLGVFAVVSLFIGIFYKNKKFYMLVLAFIGALLLASPFVLVSILNKASDKYLKSQDSQNLGQSFFGIFENISVVLNEAVNSPLLLVAAGIVSIFLVLHKKSSLVAKFYSLVWLLYLPLFAFIFHRLVNYSIASRYVFAWLTMGFLMLMLFVRGQRKVKDKKTQWNMAYKVFAVFYLITVPLQSKEYFADHNQNLGGYWTPAYIKLEEAFNKEPQLTSVAYMLSLSSYKSWSTYFFVAPDFYISQANLGKMRSIMDRKNKQYFENPELIEDIGFSPIQLEKYGLLPKNEYVHSDRIHLLVVREYNIKGEFDVLKEIIKILPDIKIHEGKDFIIISLSRGENWISTMKKFLRSFIHENHFIETNLRLYKLLFEISLFEGDDKSTQLLLGEIRNYISLNEYESEASEIYLQKMQSLLR